MFLLGVFNIDLIRYNRHKPIDEFLDSLASNSYLLYIIQPSQYTSCIDDTATTSDHLSPFLMSLNTFTDPPSSKSNFF